MKPICYDLFCGLGGWSEGFLAEGYECIGFDIEAHRYPKRIMHHDDQKTPAGNNSAVLWKDRPIARYAHPTPAEMDLHGTATEEWEEYPGTLILRDIRSIHGSELKDAAVIVASPPCQAYSYRAMPWKRAKALPPPDNTLFNECFRIQREASEAAGHHIPLIVENVRGAQKWVGRASWNYGSFYLWGDVPALMPMTSSIKNGGGSWFAIGSPGQKVTGQNPDGRKVSMNFHEHEKTGKPGRSFQSAAVADTFGWRGSIMPEGTSHGKKRKAASAMIAKIPFPLAQHIARTFKPKVEAVA